MRVPAISTISSLQPRALLLLLLLSGGIMLSLSAVIERPHEAHGAPAASDDHADAAASDDHGASQIEDHGSPEGVTTGGEHTEESDASHELASQGTQEAHVAEDAHGNAEVHDAATATVEHDATTATVEHDADESAPAIAHEPSPPTMLGINLESLNLDSPRLAVIVVGLTLLIVPVISLRGSTLLFAATIGLSLFGSAVCLREALHAGEELGIFVPLPVLAAVLYAGAGALAVLQIVTLGTRTDKPLHAHA
jgi:hypothetical protein